MDCERPSDSLISKDIGDDVFFVRNHGQTIQKGIKWN